MASWSSGAPTKGRPRLKSNSARARPDASVYLLRLADSLRAEQSLAVFREQEVDGGGEHNTRRSTRRHGSSEGQGAEERNERRETRDERRNENDECYRRARYRKSSKSHTQQKWRALALQLEERFNTTQHKRSK